MSHFLRMLTQFLCRYDPEVGYVQGSAFIVASLLLNVSLILVTILGVRLELTTMASTEQMPDEEAFCVWVRLMHSVSTLSTPEARAL